MSTNKNMISEELLATFIEGNTNAEETLNVIDALGNEDELLEEYVLLRKLDAAMNWKEHNVEIIPAARIAAEGEGNLCDFQCEQYILDKHSMDFETASLSDEARANRWLREKGTPLHSVGRLLEQKDFVVIRQYRSEIDDIIRALNAAQDVIAIINSGKLNGNVSDVISYHAVVVLEILNDYITIFDPASDKDKITYPVERFKSAWLDTKSYMARIKMKDSDYNPKPIDLDDVELSSELIDLREAIAENAHEVWADQRQAEGWTYGPKRNDEKKQHPDMVPYSQLLDSEKEYDRRMAFDTIKLMKKLGYEIVKVDDSEVNIKMINKLQDEDSVRTCDCGEHIFLDYNYCPHCGCKIDWKKFI